MGPRGAPWGRQWVAFMSYPKTLRPRQAQGDQGLKLAYPFPSLDTKGPPPCWERPFLRAAGGRGEGHGASWRRLL